MLQKKLKNDKHLRVLNESYPMNTNMTGKSLRPCALGESIALALEGLTHRSL